MTCNCVSIMKNSVMLAKHFFDFFFYYCKDLDWKRICTNGQREGVSPASTAGPSLSLDFFSIILPIVPVYIVDISITIGVIAAVSNDVFSLSFVTTDTIVPSAAFPVAICYVIVNKSAIFIFTKPADKFGLQC